ncbi:hypothetical protein [Sphingomonas sp. TZW2008]|uniref:hypothetical protein n=1 Tax=Sphingomonas sp. TZW2008 TaxID=1917973 RepID=UPI001181A0CC|nr:hypothetical protein [Sphingomonas sp. TZW2008]
MLLLLMYGGLASIHTFYVKAVFEGELQKAARDYSLEDAGSVDRQTVIKGKVERAVKEVINTANLSFDVTSYHDYKNAKAKREEFVDANSDGICNNDESYVDANNSGSWDLEGGRSANVGGSKDVLLLKATLTYASIMPMQWWTRASSTTLTASTLLRNQPASDQAAAPLRKCAR